MRVVSYSGCIDDPCIGIYMSKMTLSGKRYLNARMKLRQSRRSLDLKYQQSEPDFCAKP